MAEDPLKKADNVISRLKSYGQIIFVFLTICVGGSVAYYQIFENTQTIEDNKIDILKAIEQLRKDSQDHIDLLEERSNKRYRRGMDEGIKIWQYGESAMHRIRDLEIEQARHDEQIQNLNN